MCWLFVAATMIDDLIKLNVLLLKVFSYFLLSATCCHLQSGSKEVSWRLLTLSLQDKNFNKRNGLMFFVQMSRSLYRSAVPSSCYERVGNKYNYFRSSTQCPSPGSTGWSGCLPRRPTCTSRTPAPRSTGDSWRQSASRSLQVQLDLTVFSVPLFLSFLSFIANFGRKQLSFTFLNFLQITRHLRPG